MSAVTLHAPMAGWASALDVVPDPVFAERMMGEGLAIDPLDGVIRAPCDATVIAVAPTGHSVTLRLANGAELLIHIGLETVALAGAGFAAKVKDGDRVARGQPLIAVDLDTVAMRAKSLITPITVASEGFTVTLSALDRKVEAGDVVAEIAALDAIGPADAVGEDTAHCTIQVPLANGIHARPAARIVAALKPLAAEVSIAAHGKPANARSIVALLAAGIRHGDEIAIAARGPDARAAVAAVATLIESGMGEEAHASDVAAATGVAANGLLPGIRATPGLAVGPVFRFTVGDIAVAEQGQGITQESDALAEARMAFARSAGEDSSGIAAAHQALAEDPELIAEAEQLIAKGKSAAFAWRAATRAHAEAIRATGDALLIERIADLKDIERQIIAALTGETAAAPQVPEDAVLIADELLPSQFLALNVARIAGIVTAYGGPTSHVAILAASVGVPMLVACGSEVLEITNGARVILDADAGTLDPKPDAAALDAAQQTIATQRARATAETAAAVADCRMADGMRIEIFANLAGADEAARAVSLGAEGCGLLRSEFLFFDRDAAPDEDEQEASYRAVAEGLGGRPLIVRTLDIGGDKPVPYLPFPREENPALGARGIRFSLARRDLFKVQLRAILRGVPASQCRIMLPMVVDTTELAAARALLDEVRAELGIAAPVSLGIMVETPSAALLAESLAREADFLSVGSNDLTQYALAADRGNPAVAAMIDALHPAVLKLIALAGEGAAKHSRWLGVCGGIASDPAAAPILIGLGVTELSATAATIPTLKAKVRALTMDQCRALAIRALGCATADEVRAMLEGAA